MVIFIKECIKINGRIRSDYREIKKFLKIKGFYEYRQKSSTHMIFRNDELKKSIPVPNKSGTVPQGTLSRILLESGSNIKEFASTIKKN